MDARHPGTADAAVHVRAHPSLALIKYWGKQRSGTNIAATSSLAITLDRLTTDTFCTLAASDTITIDETPRDPATVTPVLDAVRAHLVDSGVRSSAEAVELHFAVTSTNSFPTAAGLASSASGLAALAAAATLAGGGSLDDRAALSRIARIGSGSAARSVFGGFTVWEAGAPSAEQIHPAEWWPELRVVVLPLATDAKEISSRAAMNRTRDTSPYYPAWVETASELFTRAREAVRRRDLEALGTATQLSTMRMFATMFAAEPPIVYWKPVTLTVLHRLAALRADGIPAWETMDAGPQVKVLTDHKSASAVLDAVRDLCAADPIVCKPGPGVRAVSDPP